MQMNKARLGEIIVHKVYEPLGRRGCQQRTVTRLEGTYSTVMRPLDRQGTLKLS